MKSTFAVVLVLTSAICSAGPFGLSKGMTPAQVKLQSSYFRDSILNPYDFSPKASVKEFFNYRATITPSDGLCEVQASTIRDNDKYGERSRVDFQRLLNDLSSKYGAPTTMTDKVNQSIAWSQPYNWTFSLSKGERTLKATWNANLPDSLSLIVLEAKGIPWPAESAYVQLSYEFDNISACHNSLTVQQRSNL